MIATKFRTPREKIDYILNKGSSLISRFFIVRYEQNDLKHSRYRVIVSRKIDPKAVGRNRLRRQIYEAIRLIPSNSKDNSANDSTATKNYDIIFIPKKKISESSYQEISTDLNNLKLN
ncbi:MAG: ribonuclease P protein component [Patescibacteria group bacterium]